MIQPTYLKHAHIWKRKRALTLGAARRRSFLLKLVRLFLIIAAGVLALYVFTTLVLSTRQKNPMSLSQTTAPSEMINPRFSGRDAEGAPFHMSAQRAVRSAQSEDLFNLQDPVFVFNPEGKEHFSQVKAQRGVYNRSLNILDLYDKVHFQTKEGYDFSTEHARIFLHENRIEGSSRVQGFGPLGNIRGEGFEITDDWNRYTFKGGVRTNIQDPQDQK